MKKKKKANKKLYIYFKYTKQKNTINSIHQEPYKEKKKTIFNNQNFFVLKFLEINKKISLQKKKKNLRNELFVLFEYSFWKIYISSQTNKKKQLFFKVEF